MWGESKIQLFLGWRLRALGSGPPVPSPGSFPGAREGRAAQLSKGELLFLSQTLVRVHGFYIPPVQKEWEGCCGSPEEQGPAPAAPQWVFCNSVAQRHAARPSSALLLRAAIWEEMEALGSWVLHLPGWGGSGVPVPPGVAAGGLGPPCTLGGWFRRNPCVPVRGPVAALSEINWRVCRCQWDWLQRDPVPSGGTRRCGETL